jgi:phosphoribosylaminoimidazolecarboxamide formyltransferase/IMP cyclohydrolase
MAATWRNWRIGQGRCPWIFANPAPEQAFWHTASYDQAIATYLTQQTSDNRATAALPEQWALTGHPAATLRYGENPHQPAAWYQVGQTPSGWAGAEQLQGKELSYNNLVDLEAARRIIAEFPSDQPTAAVLKHTNPCGVGRWPTPWPTAYQRAFNADSVSAFGGIVALNRAIDKATAQQLTGTFWNALWPRCDDAARAILDKKKGNLRVLDPGGFAPGPHPGRACDRGGACSCKPPTPWRDDPATWQVVTDAKPTPPTWRRCCLPGGWSSM